MRLRPLGAAPAALLLLILLLLPTLSPPAFAAPCVDYESFLHWVGSVPTTGETRGVVAGGDLFVVLEGTAGGRIFRMVPSQGPVTQGTITAIDSIQRAVFRGDHLYVADGARVVVYDLTDPTSPVAVDTLAFAGAPVRDLANTTGRLLVARGTSGLSVVDCTHPAELVVDATLAIPGTGALDVACRDDLAAVAGGDTLYTVDCATPAAPVIHGRLAMTGAASLVAWSGNWAATGGPGNGVYSVDMTNWTAPVEAALIAHETPRDLFANGDRLYWSGYLLHVHDLTDPATPVRLGETYTPGWNFPPSDRAGLQIAMLGTTLLVADGRAGGQGYEPGSAALEVPLSSTTLPSMPWDLAFCGSLAVVSQYDDGTARIFDIANPAAPLLRGTIPSQCLAVAARAPYAYTVSQDWVTIYDLTDPASPVQLGRASLGRMPVASCTLAGHYLYVAAQGGGMYPVNVQDPAAPVVLSPVVLPHSAVAVAVVQNIAYVAGSIGLSAIDVQNPAAPLVLGTASCPGLARDLAVFGGRAYVATGAGGVKIFDLGDPANMALVGTIQVPASASRIAAAGGWLYIIDDVAGLLVSDARWPDDQPGIRGQVLNTPVGMLRVRTAPGLVGALDQGALVLAAPACGELTPTFLSAFTAARGAAGTDLVWQTTGGSTAEFRVTARLGERTWEVPSRALGGGSFGATDASPLLAAGGAVVYTLWYREPGAQWLVLGVRTVELPAPRTALRAPYPNPFNPRTTIAFTLGRAERARVTVHDAQGRLVARLADGPLPAGLNELVWNGRDTAGRPLASGAYFVKLATENEHLTRRLTLVR